MLSVVFLVLVLDGAETCVLKKGTHEGDLLPRFLAMVKIRRGDAFLFFHFVSRLLVYGGMYF